MVGPFGSGERCTVERYGGQGATVPVNQVRKWSREGPRRKEGERVRRRERREWEEGVDGVERVY